MRNDHAIIKSIRLDLCGGVALMVPSVTVPFLTVVVVLVKMMVHGESCCFSAVADIYSSG